LKKIQNQRTSGYIRFFEENPESKNLRLYFGSLKKIQNHRTSGYIRFFEANPESNNRRLSLVL
jgi:hypothetical protein